MLTREQVITLRAEQISMLENIESLSKKHGLTYFLFAGTLLGAVRHQGFIPWDDDIDLAMLRDDLEKLTKIIEKDSTLDFGIRNLFTDPEWSYNHTQFYKRSKDLPIDSMIDIFPLDPCRKKPTFTERVFFKLFLRLRFTNGFMQGRKIILSSFMAAIYFLILPIPKSAVKKIIAKVYIKKSSAMTMKDTFFSDVQLSYPKGITFPVRDISDTVNLVFEGKRYPCPEGFNDVLVRMYGDYMKLPEPADRHNHGLFDPQFTLNE